VVASEPLSEKILTNHAVKPHKVRYYPEQRDAECDARLADRSRLMETLC
jgi:hypothetical protein